MSWNLEDIPLETNLVVGLNALASTEPKVHGMDALDELRMHDIELGKRKRKIRQLPQMADSWEKVDSFKGIDLGGMKTCGC
jgi:hypothetical protein